jgi:hypothetical protein
MEDPGMLGNILVIPLPPELLLGISLYLNFEDVISWKNTCVRFHCLFDDNVLWTHLEKESRRVKRKVYQFFIRHWNFSRVQQFLSRMKLSVDLSQTDRNDSLRMLCNASCNTAGSVEKVVWLKNFAGVDLYANRNLLIRHAVRNNNHPLVAYLMNNGVDPTAYNYICYDWVMKHANIATMTLIFRDGIADDIEKIAKMTCTKDLLHFFLMLSEAFRTTVNNISQDLFQVMCECNSFRLLNYALFIGNFQPDQLLVAEQLVKSVQADTARVTNLLTRFICVGGGVNSKNVLSILMEVKEAFFWCNLKVRGSHRRDLMGVMNDLVEIGQGYQQLPFGEQLLEGQCDMSPPIDYLFTLCSLIQMHSLKNEHALAFFEMLMVEFPPAKCLTEQEREFLLWFCFEKDQLVFFKSVIQPLRGNCRPCVSSQEPFRIWYNINSIYSSHLDQHIYKPDYVAFDRVDNNLPSRFQGYIDAIDVMIDSVPGELQKNMEKMWREMKIYLNWRKEGSGQLGNLYTIDARCVDWKFTSGDFWRSSSYSKRFSI